MRRPSWLRGLLDKLRRGPRRREEAEEPFPGFPLVAEERIEYSFMDKLDMFAYSLFGELATKLAKTFELDKMLAEAGITTYPVLYASRMLFAMVLSAYIAYVLAVIGIFATSGLAAHVIIIMVSALVPVFVLVGFLMYPYMGRASRNSSMEHELPFMAAYLATIARGRVTITKALERLARIEILPAAAEEARRILRDVRLFGMDPISALEKNALSHPNRHYRDFILGYTSTVRSGGDVIHYLNSKTEGLFERRAMVIKGIADKIAMLTEAYVIVAVIMGLGFYIFFSVSSITPGSSTASLTNFLLFAYVFLPLFSVFMLVIIGSLQPKTALPMPEPYKALGYSAPLGIALFLGSFYATGYWRYLMGEGEPSKNDIMTMLLLLTLSLLLVSGPPAIYYSVISYKIKGLEDHVASFLRDLVEVRKTGLSPERCIIYTSNREYGRLTPMIKDLARLLSWGLPFKRAVHTIMERTRNWFARVSLIFLLDAVDVGGGSVETLEALARFTFSLAEFEKELKSRLKPYIIMPYFGAIMNAVSTIMVISFTTQTLEISPSAMPISLPSIVMYFTLSMLLNAWIMGLVAGKLSGRYLAAGFTHAIVLTTMIYGTVALLVSKYIAF